MSILMTMDMGTATTQPLNMVTPMSTWSMLVSLV